MVGDDAGGAADVAGGLGKPGRGNVNGYPLLGQVHGVGLEALLGKILDQRRVIDALRGPLRGRRARRRRGIRFLGDLEIAGRGA